MNTKNYLSPSILLSSVKAETGFASSFGNDAANGSANFLIEQDDSSIDDTWE